MHVDGPRPGECSVLNLLLLKRVSSATVKRKAEKLLMTLIKLKPEREWISLTRKAWEPVVD